MAKRKRTNNDLQYIIHKTKDRITRTPLIIGGELGCSRRVISSCSTSDTRRVTLTSFQRNLFLRKLSVQEELVLSLLIFHYYIIERTGKCLQVEHIRPV